MKGQIVVRVVFDLNQYATFQIDLHVLSSSDGLIYKTSDHYKTFTEIK